MAVFMLVLEAQRHTGRHADALPERTGAAVDPGRLIHVGMPLQVTAKAAQCPEFIFGKITFISKNGIQRRVCMPFAEHKTITVRIRCPRSKPHFAVIQANQDLNLRK